MLSEIFTCWFSVALLISGVFFVLLAIYRYATFSWMYLLAGFFKETGMAFIVYVCVNLFFGINTIITHSVVFLLSQEKATDQVGAPLIASPEQNDRTLLVEFGGFDHVLNLAGFEIWKVFQAEDVSCRTSWAFL